MNYFEYFSEIEDCFSRRRGSILLLNTLDWALIETWREAGIPLEAVLRGINDAFDKHDVRASKAGNRNRKVNGLAWCAQAVMHAAEEMVEAATGLAPARPEPQDTGFETQRVAAYLDRNAKVIAEVTFHGIPHTDPSQIWIPTAGSITIRLRELADSMRSDSPLPLDDLDRILTALEDKLFAALEVSTNEYTLTTIKGESDRELAPYRSKMSAVQLRQVQQQFLHKRLLELRGLPRLSLFYMGHED